MPELRSGEALGLLDRMLDQGQEGVASPTGTAVFQPPDMPGNFVLGSYAPRMTDSVFIRGLEFEANHGYTAAERRATRRFRVDVELTHSLEAAARSDRLGDTIDYRRVCELIVEIGTRSTFKLLEALAGNMGRAILEEYPDVTVIIELHKLAPPCPGVPASCGVRLTLGGPAAG